MKYKRRNATTRREEACIPPVSEKNLLLIRTKKHKIK